MFMTIKQTHRSRSISRPKILGIISERNKIRLGNSHLVT
jgi:hypothetical protein